MCIKTNKGPQPKSCRSLILYLNLADIIVFTIQTVSNIFPSITFSQQALQLSCISEWLQVAPMRIIQPFQCDLEQLGLHQRWTVVVI